MQSNAQIRKTWPQEKTAGTSSHRLYMKKSTERVEAFRKRNPWHRPAEYAKRRCTDPKHKEYKRYGGAGIKYILTKEEVIMLFQRDSGHLLKKPSIDRIDPKGNYEFSNCRFIEHHDNICKREPEYACTADYYDEDWK